MIAEAFSNQRATVDENGNVIIPPPIPAAGETPEHTFAMPMEEGVWHETNRRPLRAQEWEQSVDKVKAPIAKGLPFLETWDTVSSQVRDCAGSVLNESARQYAATFSDTKTVSIGVAKTLQSWVHGTWKFLTQPVWVPGRKAPKQYGRGTLFVLDVVRFGGTFASLFIVLFLSLNYQSFWAIAQSYVSPLTDITEGKTLEHEMKQQDDLSSTLKNMQQSPTAHGDLAMLLPGVGPPEKRLIIPKLDLNVPIVTPPTDSLLREDWKQLETDIQTGLEDGVVHYPGTARPGQAGNFFVTGHSSYYYKGDYTSVFARLYQLNPGDEYWVYYGGDKFRYVIQDKKEIKPSDVSVLDQPVGKRISTLMTCTPVGTTLRRLIITAQEVDPETGKPMDVGEHSKDALPKMKLEALPI